MIDSIDVHFLRAARRLHRWPRSSSTTDFGAGLAAELNAYRWADAVLTVSSNEARLLGDFLGHERIHDIPLAQTRRRSPIPFEERNGILFIGNFRHLPNGEAVEYLCRDVLPRLDPDLLAAHPVYVVGSRLEHQASPRTAQDCRTSRWSAGSRPSCPTSSARGSASSRCCTAPASRGRSSSR